VTQALTRSNFTKIDCMLRIRESQENHASLIA
jgi:hypothetical protein